LIFLQKVTEEKMTYFRKRSGTWEASVTKKRL